MTNPDFKSTTKESLLAGAKFCSIPIEIYSDTLEMARPFVETLEVINQLKDDDYKILTVSE